MVDCDMFSPAIPDAIESPYNNRCTFFVCLKYASTVCVSRLEYTPWFEQPIAAFFVSESDDIVFLTEIHHFVNHCLRANKNQERKRSQFISSPAPEKDIQSLLYRKYVSGGHNATIHLPIPFVRFRQSAANPPNDRK